MLVISIFSFSHDLFKSFFSSAVKSHWAIIRRITVTLQRDKILDIHVKSINRYPKNEFSALPNWKILQTTISNLMEMAESYPNG